MVGSGLIQDGISSAIALSYDTPLTISVIEKTTKFPFQQELSYNGILSWLQKNFLSLKDFYAEMRLYSSTNPTQLSGPFSAIKEIIPVNPIMYNNLYIDPNMGSVGLAFMKLIGFSQVFAVDPSKLINSTGSSVVGASV